MYGIYILLATDVAKETPQLTPITISENHLENAAMRTVRCRVLVDRSVQGGSFCIGLNIPVKSQDLNSRGASPAHNMASVLTLFAIADSSL